MSTWWRLDRGGTDEEYEVYKALREAGLSEPVDFRFESGKGFTVGSRFELRVEQFDVQQQKAHDAFVRDAIESGAKREYVPRTNTREHVRELLGRSGVSTAPGA